eukprot:1134003-Pelagomonas_calceolata.AAC.2
MPQTDGCASNAPRSPHTPFLQTFYVERQQRSSSKRQESFRNMRQASPVPPPRFPPAEVFQPPPLQGMTRAFPNLETCEVVIQ